jgi:hypothetical protein
MAKKIKLLGAFFALVGLAFVAGGIFAFVKVQAGAQSLQDFSAAQNVTLSYNEDGVLVDRGEPAGAQAIMDLLEDDWGFNVASNEMDPNDPLVNTGSEYMYQMATVAYHVLNGTNTVVLTEEVEYEGETFAPGTYEVETDGKYWTDFDRSHPLEGPAREQAWSATAHGLIAELGVGSVTSATLQMGYGVAALLGGLGLVFLFTGGVLFWIAMPSKETEVKEAVAA